MRIRGFLFGCALLAACGGEAPAPEPIAIALTATVPAGGEIYRCRYQTLPDQALDIERFEHRYTAGSHHILLYPTSLTPAEAAAFPDDFDCTTVGELGQTGLAYGASEEPEGGQTFPDGVALKLAPQTVVLLEAHYLNTTDQPVDATVEVTMFPAEEEAPVAAGNLFFYNWAILVPPMPGAASATMRCGIPDDIELQFAASHMHRRGVDYLAELIDGTGQRLHATTDWESPEPDLFDPALSIAAGSTIEFRCDFENDMPFAVTEGESAERDEMCMFIASYWPKLDDETEACVGPRSAPVLAGTDSCTATLACMETAASRVEVQECAAQTCASAAPALNRFVLCVETAGCESDACIEQHCLSAYLDCEAATCQ